MRLLTNGLWMKMNAYWRLIYKTLQIFYLDDSLFAEGHTRVQFCSENVVGVPLFIRLTNYYSNHHIMQQSRFYPNKNVTSFGANNLLSKHSSATCGSLQTIIYLHRNQSMKTFHSLIIIRIRKMKKCVFGYVKTRIRFSKCGPTDSRQMDNSRHQTPRGQSVVNHVGTPLSNILLGIHIWQRSPMAICSINIKNKWPG